MESYLIQAFEAQNDSILPQFNQVMRDIEYRKRQMSLPKEDIYCINGYPAYPEGGEWKPYEKKILTDGILPEVIDLLTERGYDIFIYRDKNPTEISWEHFEDGRKGSIIYKDKKEFTLEEKLKRVLGSGHGYTEYQNWKKFKEVMAVINHWRYTGFLHCSMQEILPIDVANGLALLGYDVTIFKDYLYPCTNIDWLRAEKGKKGIVREE